MRRRITGPLLISILMHLALGVVLLVGVNIEPPKRPAGTPGAIMHAVVVDQLEFKQQAQFARKQEQQKQQQEAERVEQQKAEAEAARQQKQEEVVRLRKAEAERKAVKEAERKQEVERQRKEAEQKLAVERKKEEALKQKQEQELKLKLAEERKKKEAEKKAEEKKAEELRKKQEADKKAEEQKKLLAEKKAEEKKAEELRKKQEADKKAEEQKKLLAEKKAEQARQQKLKQDAKRLEEELFSDLDDPNATDSQHNPSASGSPGETDAYQGLIVATIQRYWLVDQTMFGKECQLKVQLAPDGLVISVSGGQGDTAVCRASVAAINKIDKFPAPPAAIYASAKNLSLTLQPGSR